jgi:hypothetical protein
MGVELDAGGIAAIITAAGVFVAALASAIVTIKSARTIKQTHGMVQQIDNAVNGKPVGGTTMVSQVQDMTDRALRQNGEAADAIAIVVRRIDERLARLEAKV